MTATDQPADLDRLRRAHTHYDHTGRDHDAHDLAAELPPLIAEVERLRAQADRYRNAMISQHDFAGHVLEAACGPCDRAADEADPQYACDQYRRWQREYEAALSTA